MTEEEMRNRIVELEDQVKALSTERDNALLQCSTLESEKKVLKEYNQKLFEKIPAVTPDIDAEKQDSGSEPSKDEKIAGLMNKLIGD